MFNRTKAFWNKLFLDPLADAREQSIFKMMNNYTPTFNYVENPYDTKIVRKAVHTIATNGAKLRAKHIRKKDGKLEVQSTNFEYLLNIRPNYFMSAFDFLYKIITQLLLKNNAFVYIERDERGNIKGYHPINSRYTELIEYKEDLFIRFYFPNGNKLSASYDDVIHLRRYFNNNDIYGESNKCIINGLNVIQAADDSIINATKQSAFLRGLLKYNQILKPEDIKSHRNNFVNDYLNINDSSGIAALDQKADYIELKNDPKMVDSNQMKFLSEDMLAYFGTNEDIVSSNYTEDQWNAFYESVLEPISIQMSQEFTYKSFTEREMGHGNEIMFEPNRIQYASIKTKIELIKTMGPMAVIKKDEMREIFNLPSMDEGGNDYVQTLNYIVASDAQEYQIGKKNNDKGVDENGD